MIYRYFKNIKIYHIINSFNNILFLEENNMIILTLKLNKIYDVFIHTIKETINDFNQKIIELNINYNNQIKDANKKYDKLKVLIKLNKRKK